MLSNSSCARPHAAELLSCLREPSRFHGIAVDEFLSQPVEHWA